MALQLQSKFGIRGKCAEALLGGLSGVGKPALCVMTADQATVTFRVGGGNFEVLEHLVRAKPDTLLCTLLDDPEHKNNVDKPIFVQADEQRFRYILDWYRFGSICIPFGIGMEEMRRECAFFQLPDDVKISRENGLEAFALAGEDFVRRRNRAAEESRSKATDAMAAYIYHTIWSSKTWDGPTVAVKCPDVQELCSSVWAESVIKATQALAEEDGFSLTMSSVRTKVPCPSPTCEGFRTEFCPTCTKVKEERARKFGRNDDHLQMHTKGFQCSMMPKKRKRE